MNAATVSGPRSRIDASSDRICNLRSAISRCRSFLLDRHEHFAVAAPDAGSARCGPTATFCSSRAASAALDTGLPLTDRITSPWPQRAGRRAVRIDVGDHRAGLPRRQLQPARHLRRDVARASGRSCPAPCSSGGSLLVVRGSAAVLCSASRSSSSTVTLQRLLLACSRMHLHRHRRARLGRDDHLHQLVAVRDRPAVELDDHVARLDAGLLPPAPPGATLRRRARRLRVFRPKSSNAFARHRRSPTRRCGRGSPCRCAAAAAGRGRC